MMKTKFFSRWDKPAEFDKEINQWLQENSDVSVKDIKLSSSESDTDSDTSSLYTALIIYEQ